MTITLPNVPVAVSNDGNVNWELMYGGEVYNYPAGEVTTVPFEVAHKHFGFELNEQGKLFRNTEEFYSDGEETQYRFTLSTIMPWSLQHKNPEEFKKLWDGYTKGITAKLVRTPKKITREMYNKLSE